MIIYNNKKMTPNQLAKVLVADKGELADYFLEDCSIEVDKLTEREIDAIGEAINKQVLRVREFLGINKILK